MLSEFQYKKTIHLSTEAPWRVLVLALMIFLFTIFIFLGMILGYKPYLKSQARNFEQKISTLNQNIDEAQQKQIATFFSQMINIKTLIANHKYYSSLFDFIEKNTHQDTFYSNLSFTVEDMNVKLEGTLKNYDYLVNQLALFHQAPEVLKVSLDSSSANEATDEVKFNIKLILDKNIFQ